MGNLGLARTMDRSALILCLLLSAVADGSARGYFVAPSGRDTNDGALDAPLRTVQKAVDTMAAGDVCHVRAGRYHESVKLEGLHGTVAAPVVIRAYTGEKVVLDGTEPILSPWRKHRGKIYKTTLKKDVWQLFVGGRMMMPARWPNANLRDGSVWEQDRNWAHGSVASEFGKMVTRTQGGRPDLAATGLDFTGAMAILNIGKWQSHSRKVTSHTAGANEFTYKADNPVLKNKLFWDNGYWERTQRYYLECHPNCLDAEDEWFYEPESRTLYLWAPGGAAPKDVRGQTLTYGIEARNVSHVALQGLSFFGCTFAFDSADHCTIADCTFDFFEHTKRMLGVRDEGLHHKFTCQTRMHGPRTGSFNTIVNCVFAYCDGGALQVVGKHDRLENVLAHDLDWSGVGYHTLHFQQSDSTLIRRATVFDTGASECISAGKGNVVELCNVGPNVGALQQDGGAIQFRPGQHFGSTVRNCWSHDHTKFGIRADIAGHLIAKEADPAEAEGLNLTIHHNVVWGIARRETKKPGINIAGDSHMVYNNLSFDNQVRDIRLSVYNGWGNGSTITRNNVTGPRGIGRSRMPAADTIPGRADHNWMGDVASQLRDVANRDFRPRKDSLLVGKAYRVMGITDKYWIRRKDLGPYDFDCQDYWIPGYQTAAASHPIPADGAKNAKPDTDLIWLHGWQSERANVYLGTDADAVGKADAKSPQCVGHRRNNIVTPKEPLVEGKTYYWRVDAISRNGDVTRGNIWSFIVRPRR